MIAHAYLKVFIHENLRMLTIPFLCKSTVNWKKFSVKIFSGPSIYPKIKQMKIFLQRTFKKRSIYASRITRVLVHCSNVLFGVSSWIMMLFRCCTIRQLWYNTSLTIGFCVGFVCGDQECMTVFTALM